MWAAQKKILPFAQISTVENVRYANCFTVLSFCDYITTHSMYQKAAVSMICISQHIKRVDYLNAPHFSCAEHPPFACLVCWKQPDFRFMHLPVAIGLLTSSLEPKWSQIFRSPDQQEQVAQYFESQVYWYINIPPESVVSRHCLLFYGNILYYSKRHK